MKRHPNQMGVQPSNSEMRISVALFLLSGVMLAQNATLPADDAIRIHEFYRLTAQIQDHIWPEWSRTPTPLLLVTTSTEFLTHHPAPPKDFAKIGDDWYARPRQFSTDLLATFPAFGPPSVIVIGVFIKYKNRADPSESALLESVAQS